MVRTVRSAGQTLLDMIGEVLDVGADRIGAAGHGGRFRPARAARLGARAAPPRGGREGAGVPARDRARRCRTACTARGASLQQILVNLTANAIKFTARRQRHDAGERRGCRRRDGDAADRGRGHRHRDCASRRRSGSSSASPRPTNRPRGAMAAPVSGSPSRASSARRWAARSRFAARRGWAPASPCARPSRRARIRRPGCAGWWCWRGRRGAAAAYRRRLAGWGADWRSRATLDAAQAVLGQAGRRRAMLLLDEPAPERELAPGQRAGRALRHRAAQRGGDR